MCDSSPYIYAELKPHQVRGPGMSPASTRAPPVRRPLMRKYLFSIIFSKQNLFLHALYRLIEKSTRIKINLNKLHWNVTFISIVAVHCNLFELIHTVSTRPNNSLRRSRLVVTCSRQSVSSLSSVEVQGCLISRFSWAKQRDLWIQALQNAEDIFNT